MILEETIDGSVIEGNYCRIFYKRYKTNEIAHARSEEVKNVAP